MTYPDGTARWDASRRETSWLVPTRTGSSRLRISPQNRTNGAIGARIPQEIGFGRPPSGDAGRMLGVGPLMLETRRHVTALGRIGAEIGGTGIVNLVRLKWAAIVLPLIALLVLVALLRSSLHDWLHESPGVFFLAASFAVCVVTFASVVFALVESLEARVIDQNNRLSELLDRTDRQNAELSALLSVSRASTSSVELTGMVDEALGAILDVTKADRTELWLAEAGVLALNKIKGERTAIADARQHLLTGEGLPAQAARAASSVVVRDTGGESALELEVRERGLQVLCALPLRLRAETVGVLVVGAREPTAFSSPPELRLLEAIGEQIALGVENAQLHERVLDRAVLEERERIARELHDGLAQVLGFINTQSQAVKKLLESERLGEALLEIDAMGAASREVYDDVREAIVGLRAAPKGLIPTLRAYVRGLPQKTGRVVELHVVDPADDIVLAPSTEIQLVRIVQEALNNARKHASASRVDVRVDSDAGALHVEITDDGQGFDPLVIDHRGWPRLGLQTMRERAQAVGGRFTVTSSPGAGTTVSVRIPLPVPRATADASTPS